MKLYHAQFVLYVQENDYEMQVSIWIGDKWVAKEIT